MTDYDWIIFVKILIFFTNLCSLFPQIINESEYTKMKQKEKKIWKKFI